MIYLHMGYLFLLIFRPYEYWPVFGTFHIEKLYMIMFIIITLVYKDKKIQYNSIHAWLASFAIVLLVSSTFAINSDKAFDMSFDYLKLVVYYVILVLTIHDLGSLKKLMFAYLIVMFLYVGKSCWEFFFHGHYVYRMGICRLIGIDVTQGDPNAFAASVCLSLPWVWVYLGKGILAGWRRLAVLSYAGLTPIAIVFTGSRSGLLTALLFLLFMFGKSNKKIVYLIIVCLTLLAGWDFLPHDLQKRFESIVSPEVESASAQASARGRIEGLLHGIDLFEKYPLLGVGPDNARLTWYNGNGFQIHNLYGQIIGETGFFGFLTFFCFVGASWIGLGRVIKAFSERRSGGANSSLETPERELALRFAKAARITLILLLFSGNFGHNLFRYNWLLMAFLAVALQGLAPRTLRHFTYQSSVNSIEVHQ